jgi:hypothetical protein
MTQEMQRFTVEKETLGRNILANDLAEILLDLNKVTRAVGRTVG